MSDAPSPDRRHDEALERFELAVAAEKKQRERELDDLKFQVPDLQWTEDARLARQGGTIGNAVLPARPMLSIPMLDLPIQLVLNQEKAANLGVQIHPVSEDADEDTAEMLQALYRRIEVDSKAGLARSWAFERAVKCGRGFYRILTEYDPAAPRGSKDQRIRIQRLRHQEAAYLDPFYDEPDASDAEWGFIVQWLPWSRYRRQPWARTGTRDGAEVAFELATYDEQLLDQLGVDKPGWVKGSGASRAVLVAEYFEVQFDAHGRRTGVRWSKMNGVEFLDTQPWPGKYVPIILVPGRELIPFDDDRRFVGIIGPNKDAQRFINYEASAVAETSASEPKNTWVIAEGQEEGHEQEFVLANVRNFPYVRYKPTSLDGTLVPGPRREQADTSKLTLSLQGLAMAKDFLHAGTGAFEPALGANAPSVKSGKQAMVLQQQHEAGNSNWLDSLAEIALTHEANVVLDLMLGDTATGRVGLYDRPGRIVRTIDPEDNHDRVMLNRPFIRRQGQVRPVDPANLPPDVQPEEVDYYDLTRGDQYGISVSIGKAYKSRLEQGQDVLGQLLQADPELLKIGGDVYFKMADFPGHTVLAERFKKLLPPPLQDQNDQQDARMQLQQAQAQLAQLQQALQAAQPDQIKAQTSLAVEKIKQSAMLQARQMDNATKIAVARISAAKDTLNQQAEAAEERLATGLQVQAQAQQAAQDRAHEVAMAAVEHQHALEQAQQAHAHAVTQAEQAAQLGAAQSAQDHAQGLEAGSADTANAAALAQQHAALQPPAAEDEG